MVEVRESARQSLTPSKSRAVSLHPLGSPRYIAHVGGGGLYPRPPFGAASRHRASTIDAWLDFSASRAAHRFAASLESAQTPKVRGLARTGVGDAELPSLEQQRSYLLRHVRLQQPGLAPSSSASLHRARG